MPSLTTAPWCFNSRAHGARDGVKDAAESVEICFNSRAHGARDASTPDAGSSACCFNSRAHGARDEGWSEEWQKERVSIHARTGRATTFAPFMPRMLLFQFTRARGARPPLSAPSPAPVGFNSRAHGARDRRHQNPAPCGRCFNSRAHGARDLRAGPGVHRGDVSIHARTGRATWPGTGGTTTERFQFTRARGARPCGRRRGAVRGVSIHARTGRATCRTWLSPPCRGFNSRAHGARDSPGLAPRPSSGFQFTRARGARQDPAGRDGGGRQVSIHARTGRATST